ncbi:MAG: hypothetical protein LC733_04660, partial [Actinobacteria bacterium]|nr:hypothetical protein [Actinomycetota bacterium]
GPYIPFQGGQFTYTSEFVGRTLQKMLDMTGRYGDLIKSLNMPPSYVILDRVVWGMSALFGRMESTNDWGALLAEYFDGAPPTSELGRAEAEWRERSHPPSAGPEPVPTAGGRPPPAP